MPKYDVFISHCTRDVAARKIYDILRSNGVKCWISPDCITYDYVDAIAQGIKDSERMIVCVSRNSMNSEDVKNEMEQNKNQRKGFIPVLMLG